MQLIFHKDNIFFQFIPLEYVTKLKNQKRANIVNTKKYHKRASIVDTKNYLAHTQRDTHALHSQAYENTPRTYNKKAEPCWIRLEEAATYSPT